MSQKQKKEFLSNFEDLLIAKNISLKDLLFYSDILKDLLIKI